MGARATPQVRIEKACRELGRSEVVGRCSRLLAGGVGDPEFIVVLGGTHALRLLDNGIPDGQGYWLRVWGARGFLWAGVDENTEALRVGLTDGSWRVREMTCKVIARHRVDDLLDEVAALQSDLVPRVRLAAARAVMRIVQR